MFLVFFASMFVVTKYNKHQALPNRLHPPANRWRIEDVARLDRNASAGIVTGTAT